ncbi:hypothetical protein K435DRAFT_874872 [Dendrothele bispora CBS 962.96]|uniref:Chromatin elongation factor spt5 n=1 Tax=Dendrothele bispora (strain CBS 962.96) TaxID=1314807 RepID=A0A4S8KVZ0_DENBC|nr:hypothetical protein K435DRAFT_874872 [Dendrothele bispora CBS 962.96]
MSNPFVDLQAQVYDEGEDWIDGEPLFLPGSDDEEGVWGVGDEERGEEDSEHDENHWDNEDEMPREAEYTRPTFVDYLLERYTNPRSTPPPPPTGDDVLSNVALRAALLSTNVAEDTFWRIKCKPGYEFKLVSDIMHREQTRAASSTTPPKPLPLLEPVEAQAFSLLCGYCVDPNATIPAVETELRKMLGTAYNDQWNQALSAGSLLDPDEDPSAPLDRLLAMKQLLVPAESLPSTSTPSEQLTSQPPSPSSSNVRSAFCVPTVTGSVYVEADLGLRPQDTEFVEYLRNHKAVFKRQRPFYKSKTLRRNQSRSESSFASRPWLAKPQVWLERVPCDEVAALLETPTSTIKLFSWVKITRGEYQGDVGLVVSRQKSTIQRRLMVLLVPRLPPKSPMPRPPTPEPKETHPLVLQEAVVRDNVVNLGSDTTKNSDLRKRKRGRETFPQSLFNADDYPDDSFDYCSVTQVDVNMDETTRRFFRASKHPFLQSVCLPVPKDWVFFHHDKVEVFCTEPLSDVQRCNLDLPRQTMSRNAVVTEMEGDRCKVCFDDYWSFEEDDTAEWVSKINLRKRIYEGDSVEVAEGEKKGRKGIVIFSLDGLLNVHERESNTDTDFWVEANICKVTTLREGDGVPWIGRLVTVFKGTYLNYRGVVQDVHPPRPYFTTLDVKIPRLLTTITIGHDDVYDSDTYKWLRVALPLAPHQMHFHQPSWDAAYAPNLEFCVWDYHERRYLQSKDMMIRQPPQPWIGKEVRVVGREWKSLGFVKEVERTRKSASGLRFLVELKILTAVYGLPERWFDYSEVFDPRTGNSLDQAYPLTGHQKRYWQPLATPRHIKPDADLQPVWISPFQMPARVQTPPWNAGDFVDPFATSEASAGSSTISRAPTHWVSDPRLVGKKFYARWAPLNDIPMEKQVIEPGEHGIVKVYSGAEVFIAHSDEIYDCNVRILPKTNKRPMVAIRGEHTGKNLRQIYYKYDDNGKEVIVAAVYRNWALSNEEYVEQVEVRPEDLAEAPNDWRLDPNEKRFAGEMKKMRDEARQKRVRKPKGKD